MVEPCLTLVVIGKKRVTSSKGSELWEWEKHCSKFLPQTMLAINNLFLHFSSQQTVPMDPATHGKTKASAQFTSSPTHQRALLVTLLPKHLCSQGTFGSQRVLVLASRSYCEHNNSHHELSDRIIYGKDFWKAFLCKKAAMKCRERTIYMERRWDPNLNTNLFMFHV